MRDEIIKCLVFLDKYKGPLKEFCQEYLTALFGEEIKFINFEWGYKGQEDIYVFWEDESGVSSKEVFHINVLLNGTLRYQYIDGAKKKRLEGEEERKKKDEKKRRMLYGS